MVGHRSFSEHVREMACHTWHLPVKMAGRKRASASYSSNVECSQSAKKDRRQITIRTFERWQGQYNTPHESLTWLLCDKDPNDRSLVSVLLCEPCRKYEARIRRQKNFSTAWIQGTPNLRTSSVVDHANSNQHKAGMSFLKVDLAKANNEPVMSFSTLARSLMNMDAATRDE